jgi:hypothetical protein
MCHHIGLGFSFKFSNTQIGLLKDSLVGKALTLECAPIKVSGSNYVPLFELDQSIQSKTLASIGHLLVDCGIGL